MSRFQRFFTTLQEGLKRKNTQQTKVADGTELLEHLDSSSVRSDKHQPDQNIPPRHNTSSIESRKRDSQKPSRAISSTSKVTPKGARNQKSGKQETDRVSGRSESHKAVHRPLEPGKNKNIVVTIKGAGEEKFRKKQVRRNIREQLDELLKRGEECETDQVLEFIATFNNDLDLVREVLAQFVYSEGFPVDAIRQYLSLGSLEGLCGLLEEHKLLMQLLKQRDAIKLKLPNPIVVHIETTEHGPGFASITPERVQQLIGGILGISSDKFSIEEAFHFTHTGDYSIELDFSQGVKLPVTIRLEVQPDELPGDCVQDFKDIAPLSLLEPTDVLPSLQDYLTQASPVNVVAYSSHLSIALVTAYRAGYGKNPWVQELLREWRNKRGEYSLAQGVSKIKEAIEQINDTNSWLISKDRDTKDLSEDKILEIPKAFVAKNPVLSRYDLEICIEDDIQQAVVPVDVSWRGLEVGTINLHRPALSTSYLKSSRKERPADGEYKSLSQELDLVFNKALLRQSANSVFSLLSSATKEFQALAKLLKQDLLECEVDDTVAGSLPASLAQLQVETRAQGELTKDRAERFLRFARAYAEQGDEFLFQFCLTEYCYLRGCHLFYETTRRDAQPYLRLFLFLHDQISSDGQHGFVRAFYNALSFYLRTYDMLVDVKESTVADIAEKFYTNLLGALSLVARQRQYESLGRCLVEIAVVNSSFVFDLINRMNTYKDTQSLRIIALSLQEARVFRTEPWYCLHILAQIDPSTITGALSKQSISTVDERKRLANALVKFASLTTASTPNIILNGLVKQATSDTIVKLASALLVEPFILDAPEKESDLKANLIAEALGLPPGVAATEYFLGKVTELATLFDRFAGNQDPNIKARYAITILDTVSSTRRRFMDQLREIYGDQMVRENYGVVTLFFRRTEEYATAEQAKLIHDTTLEMVLVSDRTLHSSQNTRLTVEIHNVGEGIADHLELEVFPVNDKYTVEDHRRIHKIDILPDKTPVQIEIFIQPLVGANESVELSLILRYDTLKKKGKTAELAITNRSVWLYPESQFVRVTQPYNTGVPATTWFYGRQDVLESMADNLRTGSEHDTSMIVFGLKRAGKTSVVQRFINHTLHERGLGATHLPIYVDLLLEEQTNEIKTDGDFLYFLIEIIVNDLISQRHEISIPFNLSQMREEFYYHPFKAFSVKLREILRVLDGRRLLLVLDEFSTLYEKTIQRKGGKALTPEVFAFLSNMIQSTHQLTFIFTGTYMLLEMMRTHVYDLAKICNPHMITFLDDPSARQLVKEPVKRDDAKLNKGWLEYDQRVVDRIVTYTHRHPYLIQYLCMQVVNRMNILKYHRVNLNDINSIINDIVTVSANEAVMLNLWNDFGLPQQKVLCAIAAHTSANQDRTEVSDIAMIFKELGETMNHEEIDTVCASLADAELLEKTNSSSDQSESYKITIPLYQLWLKQNKPLQAVFGKRFVERMGHQ